MLCEVCGMHHKLSTPYTGFVPVFTLSQLLFVCRHLNLVCQHHLMKISNNLKYM